MAASVSEMLAFIGKELKRLADPARATQMAAYMKTKMPFYGVSSVPRAEIVRSAKKLFHPENHEQYVSAVTALWRLDHREEKYIAIAIARAYPTYARVEASLPLFENMVRTGQWWDFVDEIASHLVGGIVDLHTEPTLQLMDKWVNDPDMWIRRTAILCQLRRKAKTDSQRLLSYCTQRSHETEFFIRKAIGWSLREYAKTNQKAVAKYVVANRDSLSSLSFKEATKHISAKTLKDFE